jgi:hypothetical protein
MPSITDIVKAINELRADIAVQSQKIDTLLQQPEKKSRRKRDELAVLTVEGHIDFVADPDAKLWWKVHLKGVAVPFSTRDADAAVIATRAHSANKAVAIEFKEAVRKGFASRYIQTITVLDRKPKTQAEGGESWRK